MMIAIGIRQSRYGCARSLAEVGVIALRPNDPVIPAQVFEADIEGLPAALARGGSAF